MKHTKGNWSNTGLDIRSQSSLLLATVYKHLESNQSKEEALANAKLIASAPKLLEALKLMYETARLHGLPEFNNSLQLAEEAIKQATE